MSDLRPGPISGASAASAENENVIISESLVSNATQIQVSGLDFRTYEYELSAHVIQALSGSQTYYLRVGGVTNSLNRALFTLTNATQARFMTGYMQSYINVSDNIFPISDIRLSGLAIVHSDFIQTGTLSNITSVEIICSVSNGIQAGSRLTLIQKTKA